VTNGGRAVVSVALALPAVARIDARVRASVAVPTWAESWVIVPRAAASGHFRTCRHTDRRKCQRLITSAAGQPRADVRAAKEVIRWLELLDLL
jgi:hypothetical protein